MDNPYYFTGREYDFETGLYYYRARYYDSALGRFIQIDPIGYLGGINLYAYVKNNPGNWIDPWGLLPGGIPEGGPGGGIPGLGGGTGIPPAGGIPGSGGPIGGDGPEGGNGGGIPGLGDGGGIPPADDIPGTGGPPEDDGGDDPFPPERPPNEELNDIEDPSKNK